MKISIARLLERISGGLLLLGGVAWLVLGLHSLSSSDFMFRGAVVVVLISSFLMLAGAMLVKPRSSSFGRIFAAVVCILGAFREGMLMSHGGEMSLTSGNWLGFVLLFLYVGILAIIVVNQFRGRGAA